MFARKEKGSTFAAAIQKMSEGERVLHTFVDIYFEKQGDTGLYSLIERFDWTEKKDKKIL